MTTESNSLVQIPRIAIKFCTQCKWNLRAAYYAQELLQTFGTSVGEIALQPVTGGIFTVTITHASSSTGSSSHEGEVAPAVTETLLWDRKAEGGFPETKELKNRVRNIIEPGRDLGHIDRSLKKQQQQPQVDQNGGKSVADENSTTAATSQAESQKHPELQKNNETDAVHNPGEEANSTSKADCEDCK